MAREVVWTRSAGKDLKRLSKEAARRARAAVHALADDGGDVKRLRGSSPPRYRLRVGSYRVLYELDGDGRIHVLRVLHRREAYR